jgi:hypothetical protein
MKGDRRRMPTLVFLHEGLGGIALWDDFPDALCRATCCRGLIYERPRLRCLRPAAVALAGQVLEQEAEIVIPRPLDVLNIDRTALIGRSEAATIARLYRPLPERVVRATITWQSQA